MSIPCIGGVVPSGLSFVNISTAVTTAVKLTPGSLHTVTINTKGSGSTATIYDGLSAAGIKIAVIDTATAPITFTYDAKFSEGLTIVTVGTADLTVTFH